MPSADGPRRHSGEIVLWLILALALALRVWLLADKNLWLDESVSWQFATGSFRDLVHGTAADIHPPLYYVMLKVWVAVFGDSLAGLRSLSVVFGVAAAYLMFRLSGRSLPRVVAYAALFWFAIAPHAILFSQEARMYATVTAFVLGACLAYRRWVDSGFASGRALAAYAACVVVCLYLHYFTSFVVAAIWLHAVLLATGATRTPTDPPERLPLTTWIVVHLVIGAIYLPWITTATSQVSRGQSWRQAVTLAQIPANARDLFAGLIGGFGWYSFGSVFAIVAVAVLAVGVVRLAIAAVRGREPERDMFFLIVTVVPMVLGLALLPFAGRMDLARYLPYALPFLLIAAARGFATVRMPPVAAAMVLVIGALATLPALQTYYQTHVKDSDTRPIVAYLEHAAHALPGSQDAVFVAPGYVDTVLRYISRDSLVYRQVEAGDLWKTLDTGVQPFHEAWLVVDYRWPDFKTLGQDPRLREVEVPSGHPEMVKLFRVFSHP